MPEARLARARKSLPEGYQFGDGGAEEWSEADAVAFIRNSPLVMFPRDFTVTYDWRDGVDHKAKA